MNCPEDFEGVEKRIDRVLTQYRESPKLLHVIRTYLRQVEIVQQAICELPEAFTIDNAVGDQLTLLGRRMGWPRVHCVCTVQPVFGFDCGSPTQSVPVEGFCSSTTWADCTNTGISYISVDDDDLYRKMLRVRQYQMTQKFTRQALLDCIRILFGETAKIMYSGNGEVVIAPFRQLTNLELTFIQLFPRVLPLPLGVRVRFHFGSPQIFGFGIGFLGFCEGSGGDGAPLMTEEDEDEYILTENGEPILVNATNDNPEWLCKLDVRAYDC